MSKIYNPSGGFRKLHSFNFATIIHLGTISFCKRYIPWKDDPLGKTFGQMIGASRSGKQNIIEGSERAKTSSETEIKLTDVAKASLNELQGDLEDYLVQKGSIPWSIRNSDHHAVLSIRTREGPSLADLPRRTCISHCKRALDAAAFAALVLCVIRLNPRAGAGSSRHYGGGSFQLPQIKPSSLL